MTDRNVPIRFKTQHLAEQFELIRPSLRGILLDAAFFVSRKFGYDAVLTITDLIRTQAEQDSIYLNHPDPTIRQKYKEKPWSSVHQYGRGGDVRVEYTNGEIKEILDYVNGHYVYDPSRPAKPTAIVHDAGNGKHIHMQVM